MHVSESGDFLHLIGSFVDYATSGNHKHFCFWFCPSLQVAEETQEYKSNFLSFAEEIWERRLDITCGTDWHVSRMLEVKASISGFLQLIYSLYLKYNWQLLAILALGNTRQHVAMQNIQEPVLCSADLPVDLYYCWSIFEHCAGFGKHFKVNMVFVEITMVKFMR